MDAAVSKWMGYMQPLGIGRFDFFTTAQDQPRWNTMFNGIIMTLGRWWVRVAGGTNLRRAPNGRIPTVDDPICGVANGDGVTIRDSAAICSHAAGSRWVYGITAVGAGGVEEQFISSIREVVFDAGALWSGELPNAAMGLTVKPNYNGSFNLIFRYDEKGQQAAPAMFNIYASPKDDADVDYGTPIGTVDYLIGKSEYAFTTGVIADGTPGLYKFAVRAESADGAEEKNDVVVIARNTTTAEYGTVRVYGSARDLIASPGSLGD